MSLSSVLSPSAWASQIAGKNPLAAAATYGAGSFASALMQALQPAGTAASSTGTAAASTAPASAAASGAIHGHHHVHHGSGQAALLSLLQNLPAGSATAPGLGRLLNTRV